MSVPCYPYPEYTDVLLANTPEIELPVKEEWRPLSLPSQPVRDYLMFAGYCFAVIGGFIGFFVGWHLSRFKRVLPDGRMAYVYDRRSRLHGKCMVFLSVMTIVLFLFTKFA